MTSVLSGRQLARSGSGRRRRAPPEKIWFLKLPFVDDVAALLAATTASLLLRMFPILIEELCHVLVALGFRINWAQGKTEAFVSLRGKRSHIQKQNIIDAGNVIAIDPACGSSSVRVVATYKHLGSMLDSEGGHAPDVEVRTQRAMASYAPLAKKVYGAVEISRTVRLRLFFALVVSRLVYNVQTWGEISRDHYKRLNAVYMRGLRMIAGRSRFSRESGQEAKHEDVRRELGAMSLACLLLQRRPRLLGQIVRHGNPQLLSLLATVRRDGAKISWVRSIAANLQTVFEREPKKLAELGPPLLHPEKWWSFIRDFPRAWAQIVAWIRFSVMPCDQQVSSPSPNPDVYSGKYSCSTCSLFCFFSERALSSHIRRKHEKVSDVSRFVGKSRRCCVCSTLFSTRTWLIAHLSDKRSRGSRGFNCRQVVVGSGFVEPVDDHEYQDAHLQDRASRRTARKRGHSQPLSLFCVKRAKIGMSMADASRQCIDDDDEVPPNMFNWFSLPPAKRLRHKTSSELVMSQWIHKTSHSNALFSQDGQRCLLMFSLCLSEFHVVRFHLPSPHQVFQWPQHP